jgi:hypothetical protein
MTPAELRKLVDQVLRDLGLSQITDTEEFESVYAEVAHEESKRLQAELSAGGDEPSNQQLRAFAGRIAIGVTHALQARYHRGDR